MADIYRLAGLTLPPGVAHESLPATVTVFIAECWPGMSRTQMGCPREAAGFASVVSRHHGVCIRRNRRVRAAIQRWCGRMPDAGTSAAGWSNERSGPTCGSRTDVSRPPARDPRRTRLF
jgi:hypothetical protein